MMKSKNLKTFFDELEALAFYIDNYDRIIAKTRNENGNKELIPHEEVLKIYAA